MAYEYYSSPENSARAIAFRKAYAKAKPGETLWFEGQPYAVPAGPGFLAPEIQQYPGLNAEEGPGTATGYVEIPRIPESDRAYMSPEMVAEIAAKEANRKRLGARIGGRTKVLRDRPVWDHFEKRWVEPEGSFAQSQHGLDALEQERLIGNSTPSYLATSPKSERHIPGFQNIIGLDQLSSSTLPRRELREGEWGQGLLSDQPHPPQSSPMVDRDWIDNPTPTQQPLLASSSGVDKSGTTDRSGWEKNKVMWDLIRMGLSSGDPWEPGVEY